VISPFETTMATDINAARAELVRSLASELRLQPGTSTAIDVGCGALAFFATVLLDCGYVASAVDGRVENVVEAQRRHPGLNVAAFDVEDRALADLGRFDLVLA